MKTMIRTLLAMGLFSAGLTAAVMPTPAAERPIEPFAFEANYDPATSELTIAFTPAPAHYLYADMYSAQLTPPARLDPLELPEPTVIFDTYSETEREVYQQSFQARYAVSPAGAAQLELTVRFQGCNAELCFLPATRSWSWPLETAAARPPANAAPTAAPPATNAADWRQALAPFTVIATDYGYRRPPQFLDFLALGGGATPTAARPLAERPGAWLLVLLGGFLLNLTPCVLPMIPINLAIIGAGARAGSLRRGFLLGAAYGLGMALAYGALGLVVILTQTAFGTLNASPWFNAAIAALFVVLALAMFDVFHLDLSRFQGRIGQPGGRHGIWWLSFSMGAVAALLAGACVAPVVISVLVWAGDLYHGGAVLAGVLLPFLLGLGMALPWPLAGAGLAFLPKPGNWMIWVRNGFGLLILVLAAYYGRLAFRQFTAVSSLGDSTASAVVAPAARENQRLAQALTRAAAANRPVLIDFWATWCKNCLAMDDTTFQDPEVVDALSRFEFVKYQAEQPDAPETRAVLEHFGVIGLPTYIILSPAPGESSAKPSPSP